MLSDTPYAQQGQPAPDFQLKDQQGATVSLSQYQGAQPVVVFFYPKDHTPGCTLQACAFRDTYTIFQDTGAEVLGISSDSDRSHKRFADTHQLPFPLLSDPDGVVRKTWSVPKTLGIFPGRVTYVIDRQGIIRYVFASQLNIKRHINEALSVLTSLSEAN